MNRSLAVSNGNRALEIPHTTINHRILAMDREAELHTVNHNLSFKSETHTFK